MNRAIASIALLFGVAANAGPLGYEMGQRIEGDPDGRIEGALIKMEDAPAPFDSLTLHYTPTVGVCMVSASLDDKLDMGDGGLKGRFDALRSELTHQYGEPTTSSKSYVVWRKSLYDGDVSTVALSLFRQLNLSYTFSNFSDCVEEATIIKSQAKDVKPFGYEMGQKVKGELDGMDSDGLLFRLITHDLPPPFTSLGLIYTPNVGICEIQAVVDTDDYNAQFTELKAHLTEEYGNPISIDSFQSIWPKTPNFNVRNIRNILILALRQRVKIGNVLLTYTFTNKSDCEAEAKAARPEATNDGPFGYEMGQKVEGEPDGVGSVGLPLRFIPNPPAPFTDLTLMYTPDAGICKILARITTDDYDRHFSSLKVHLTDKYGSPTYEHTRPEAVSWDNINADNIDLINLIQRKESATILIYHFTNSDACEAEAKAMRQKSPLQELL